MPTRGGPQKFNWLYKLRMVARWRDLSWEYFRELDTDDQAAYVAEYETQMSFDYHQALDLERKRRRAARRGRGK